MEQSPQTLEELIAWIREKPGLFLEHRSVVLLSAFLDGWTLHRNSIEENHRLTGFTTFCAKRFKINNSQGWWRIIEFYSINNEESWALFEELWDEYTAKPGT
jgi:hypothetical protein